MKFLLASFLIATASSTALMAAPDPGQPASPAETPDAASAERFLLARQFVALAQPASERMDSLRGYAAMAAYQGLDDPEDEKALQAAEQKQEQILARLDPIIQKRMPQLLDAYAQAYAREFSAEELEQLIAFAQSPAGKHYVTRAFAAESDDAVMGIHQTIADELGPVMRDIAKEVCSERAAQRLAAGDLKAKCPLSSEPETLAS